MKLTYRGVSYNYEPSFVETKEVELVGKYRGLDWRFRNLKKPPVLLPTANLTYRGVAYNKPGTVTEQNVARETVPVNTMQQKARTLMFGHSQKIKKRQLSMLNRTASAIGLSGAKCWNRIQGKVHPTFRSNYDRYGATMS